MLPEMPKPGDMLWGVSRKADKDGRIQLSLDRFRAAAVWERHTTAGHEWWVTDKDSESYQPHEVFATRQEAEAGLDVTAPERTWQAPVPEPHEGPYSEEQALERLSDLADRWPDSLGLFFAWNDGMYVLPLLGAGFYREDGKIVTEVALLKIGGAKILQECRGRKE